MHITFLEIHHYCVIFWYIILPLQLKVVLLILTDGVYIILPTFPLFFCLYISFCFYFVVFVHESNFAPMDSLSLFCVTKSTGKLWSFKHSTFGNLVIDALFEGAKLFYELDRPSVTYSLAVILFASYHPN